MHTARVNAIHVAAYACAHDLRQINPRAPLRLHISTCRVLPQPAPACADPNPPAHSRTVCRSRRIAGLSSRNQYTR
eukprot:10149324-Lingulodinium_polyedra.AAC.1